MKEDIKWAKKIWLWGVVVAIVKHLWLTVPHLSLLVWSGEPYHVSPCIICIPFKWVFSDTTVCILFPQKTETFGPKRLKKTHALGHIQVNQSFSHSGKIPPEGHNKSA